MSSTLATGQPAQSTAAGKPDIAKSDMSALESKGICGVLGSSFVGHSREALDSKIVCDADIICLYFGAQSNTACREFTPVLSKWYTDLKKQHKSIQVLFCSRDHDAESFNTYFHTMSFPAALPFGDTRVQNLMTTWGISSIPALVVLDKSGRVLRMNGRDEVSNLGIQAFDTWCSSEVKGLGMLGTSFVGHSKEALDVKNVLDADIICLFFGAQWCATCREFTPVLAKWYTDLKKQHKNIQVIFASRDHDVEAFNNYFHTMPFTASLPYGDARVQNLMTTWGISSIPALVVLDKSGRVLRMNGRDEVSNLGIGAFDTWRA